jgi:hypothetical protein
VNAGERGGGFLRLVRLQVADEMPPYLHVGRFADLLQGFLDLVFAEVTLAGGPGGADVIGAERFRDRDELDVRRVPAGAAGGRADPGRYRLKVGRNGGIHRLRAELT